MRMIQKELTQAYHCDPGAGHVTTLRVSLPKAEELPKPFPGHPKTSGTPLQTASVHQLAIYYNQQQFSDVKDRPGTEKKTSFYTKTGSLPRKESVMMQDRTTTAGHAPK